MKLLPLALLSCLLSGPVLPVSAQTQTTTQDLLSAAQTAYIRGDLPAAKRDFEMVNRIDPRNQLAINYLRIIKTQEAKMPRGNEQERMLSQVIIPKIEFQDATLGSIIDYLRGAVAKATEGKQAVNFVVALPEEQARTQTVTLKLNNVPFTEVLRYLGELSNVQFEYEKYAIKVKPKGMTANVPAPAAGAPAVPGLTP